MIKITLLSRSKFFAAIFIFSLCLAHSAAFAASDGLYEVTVRGRGASEQEALDAAVDEAIRNTLGSIFAERSELGGEMLEEKLIQFSRGSATNYRVAEKIADDTGIVLTVVVTVDSRKIKENVRTLKAASGGGAVEHWKSPLLEAGQKAVAAMFDKVHGENYIKAAITEKKSDPRKGLLSITVSLTFDKAKFYKEFARPVGAKLDDIFANPALKEELAGEFDTDDERYAVAFELLGENLSSRIWTMPRNFWDAMKRSAGFWVAAKGRIATQKRMWFHFSLMDNKGNEIERIPVHLPVSNVIFFSDVRKTSDNPWFYLGLADGNPSDYSVIVASPHFGVLSKNGYLYYGEAEQRFDLELEPALAARVSNIRVSLELER